MLRVAVTNPTALSNNADAFSALPFDLCMVSETSTTMVMQRSYSKAYKQKRIHITWGAGVPPLRLCASGEGSIRGSCLGVAVLSRGHVAVRPSRDCLPEHLYNTCRIMVSFAQLSSFTVRLVTIYGVPSAAPGASNKNAVLWAAVLGILQGSDMPTLVGGDFNCRPQAQSSWPAIAALGYAETFEHHLRQFGVELPPTCMSSTRHDSLVFSRHFLPTYSGARVISEGTFPAHDPLVVDSTSRFLSLLLVTLLCLSLFMTLSWIPLCLYTINPWSCLSTVIQPLFPMRTGNFSMLQLASRSGN